MKRVNADMSIKNLYRYSSESVFNLLYLISEEVIGLSEKNMFELILIIKEHSQDMSYKMYKIILKITAKYGDERLEECIRQFFD